MNLLNELSQIAAQVEGPALTPEMRAEIQKWIDLYPKGGQRSAILPALYVIQRHYGYCKVEAQNELAEIL